jgi:hypothetical protein
MGYYIDLSKISLDEYKAKLESKEMIPSRRILKEKCFSEEYLKILLRELNSILPKPSSIRDFINISPETIVKLEKHGIKNTLSLFEVPLEIEY